MTLLLKRLALLLFLAAIAPAQAITIDKLIPFTTDSSVRIDLVASTDQDEPDANVVAAIVSPKTRQILWSGTLAKLHLIKGQPTSLSHKINVIKAQLWSPSSPSLYLLTVQAQRNGKILATKSCRVGFRSFVARDGQFLLNGKPIFLRGLAINPPGRSIAPEVGDSRAFAERYVKCLRDDNVNIIRLERDSQTWFDVCDEQGMMIYQGAYGSPPNTGGKSQPPDDIAASIAGYRNLFETYAAHPSIVTYILSNELPYIGARGRAWHDFLTEAHKQLSQWDPTRPYIGNAGYGQGRQGNINDIHRYWGWYYNSFLTYYNLRDPHLFGDYEKNQPLTFSECVGCFTGPSGQFNLIYRKQLAAELEWTGHSANQRDDALNYQAFLAGEAIESFRRMRSINPRLAGLMPFTIPFFNYNGVTSFEQMRAKPVLDQMRISYQPVLLSWECWTRQVYAGTKLRTIAHVINDAEDASDLKDARLEYSLKDAQGTSILSGQVKLPTVPYYSALPTPIELTLPDSLDTGDYKLVGTVNQGNQEISRNQIELFIAGKKWKDDFPKIDVNTFVFDPTSATTTAMEKLGIHCRTVASSEELKRLVQVEGRRVLVLDPQAANLDEIQPLTGSANESTYPVQSRPTRDGMYINIQRPWHPVFTGVDRRRLRTWSDDSCWDQSKPGFPSIYPVTLGFKLKRAQDLATTAILADYDRGLEGIALCEIFDGKGSMIVSAFDFANHLGVDPVADRLLANLVAYTSSPNHELHPMIESPIIWGDYATERGVLTGPLNGLIYNCRWVPTETNRDRAPMADNTGSWNGLPGDQFVAKGVRPFGPFTYSTGTTPRDLKPESDTGQSVFYAAVPSDRTIALTKVENPGKQPAIIAVTVNGSEERRIIAPSQTISVRNSIPGDHAAVEVRYSGAKSLVILQTSFEK